MLVKTIDSNKIEIDGNIKDMEDFNKIKDLISSMALKSGDSLMFLVKNSFSMPSAIIGYLLKLIQQDKVNLSMHIQDERLVELLDDLNLKTIFNVHHR